MEVKELLNELKSDFFVGVPDSQLKPLCNYLINNYGINQNHHIIAANEGNCVAIAAGYYMATNKVPVVYLQNSGEGNIINPVASLLNDKVYGIPMIFVVGWRGEPGVHDEPQHIFQGEITLKLLEDLNIATFVIDKNTTINDIQKVMIDFNEDLKNGMSVAFVVKKNSLAYSEKINYTNENQILREEIIKHITLVSKEDPIVSTTGKASRELFEIREANNQSHKYDFLTVGSMGHASSIALGIAINKPNTKIWCIDGDGAALMHMGSMAVIGNIKPNNLVHVIINNGAHETVGGMPTVASNIDFVSLAKACGYEYAKSVDNIESLDEELIRIKESNKLSLLEVKCSIGSRDNLGRPTTSAKENKNAFMDYINTIE